jgi:predicted lipoprotein with Yx(FWY)xxD motif
MTAITHRRLAVAGALASGVLLAATACSTSGSDSTTTPPSSGTSSTSAAAAVHTVDDAKLGAILVNGKGFTLYRFDADTAKPSASHCTGTCAVQWPAVPATAASSVQGVDAGLVGSVTRPGGSTQQLTIAGWPVYTYAQDSKAGDTNGQGVDGTWWAITPSGGKAPATGTSPDSPGTSPSGPGTPGGYGY